ncbi:MAG: DUF4838 domain-containing protein [Victivallales bacterium]|nr:DUF4838 domain-containing protein [Victivallales bacterium]
MSWKSTCLLLLCWIAMRCSALPLFSKGQSDWRMEVSPEASATELYAAEELRTYLQKIGGVELPLGRQVTGRPRTIAIGTAAGTPGNMALAGEANRPEEFEVTSDGTRLLLTGSLPRAVLYAVYSFLEQELGCRWYWPGEDGEFVERLEEFEMPVIHRHEKAAFPHRELTPCGWHRHAPTETWMARNYLNRGSRTESIRDKMGFIRGGGGHLVAVKQKLFPEHPEWFSLLDGRREARGYAGCWSNPDFTAHVVRNIVDHSRRNNLEMLNIFPADIVPRCECDACTQEPDRSQRWYDYYWKLQCLIRQEIPEMRFSGIAYQEYMTPPRGKVQGLEYVQHCQYNRCYVHGLLSPDCLLNQKVMEQLSSWQRKATMGIYGYHFDVFNRPLYLPVWNVLQDEARICRDRGLVMMKTEMSVRYPENVPRHELTPIAHRLANYAYARLLWNPDLDLERLIDDWCRRLYGAASAPMKQYHLEMAKAWDGMNIHLTYFGGMPDGAARQLLNEGRNHQIREFFQRARQSIEDEELARIFAERDQRLSSGEDPLTVNRGIASRLVALREKGFESRCGKEVETEWKLFESWENVWRINRENTITVVPPLLAENAAFAEVPRLPMKSASMERTRNSVSCYYSREALHVQIDMPESELRELPPKAKAPRKAGWGRNMVEVFLSDGKVPYWHFATNPEERLLCALGRDSSWDSAWNAVPSLLEDGGWRVTCRIPFADLGGFPKDGTQWFLAVDAPGQKTATGLPFPSYHDVYSGASLLFTGNTVPGKQLIWISRQYQGLTWFETNHSTLARRGWQTEHFKDASDAEAHADFTDARLIVLELYQNPFSQQFFDQKLAPAIQKGAVALLLSYFWVGRLHEQFRDELFRMGCEERAHGSRRTVSFLDESFATMPNDLRKSLKTTPPVYFAPAHPESWRSLLTQHDKQGVEHPYCLARPLGKGMVVLMGSLYRNFDLLDNILEYNHHRFSRHKITLIS